MSSGGYSHGSASGEEEGSVTSAYYSETSHQPQDSGALSRPKRAQVKNACVNCQRACKKCDNARPCQRCVKYGLLDTCVDSTRKPRKKGIKRGPYKKRKTVVTPSRSSTSSARARTMSDRPLVPPHLDETHAETPKDIHGLAHPPLANSSSALGAYGGDPGLPRSAGYRLPPIGSFDYSPPRRSHLAGNFLPPPPRARSELPPPPMRSSRSGYVNTDYASRHAASPLGMLSDVAINSTNQPHGGNNAYGRHTQPPPPLAMSHSMHSLSTKPRFDPYASSTKHIPISSSRFDCTYRMPHIPDDRNYSASPWESPDPATRSNYSSNVASPALPRPNAFDSDAEMPVRAAREQAREMDSSCAMADVHVRRLSSLFDRTCINPGSPSPLLDRTNTCNGDQQRGLDGLDQTSNTGLATPEFDVRRVLCQEQPRAADIAWRTEEDPEKTPIVASVADGCKGMPVMAISSRHKKSLSGYKL